MKTNYFSIALGCAAAFCLGLLIAQSQSAEQPPVGAYEYATIRWAGRDNTHLIRPGGKTEIIGEQLRLVERPDKVDERAFYLNLAMAGLVKEGYEFAGITDDMVIMKRPLVR
jgi:hypothetical protein